MKAVTLGIASTALVLVPIVALAWSGPSANPPSNNASAPINISTTNQAKGNASNVPAGNNGYFGANGFCIAGSCLTSWPAGGSSQWTTNGTSIYYNSGNVGIGTASPSYPLWVTGSGNVAEVLGTGSGARYNALIAQTQDAGTQAFIGQNTASGNYCYIGGGSGSAAGNNALYCAGSGLVQASGNNTFGLSSQNTSGTSGGLGTNGGILGYTHVGGGTSVGVEGAADNGGIGVYGSSNNNWGVYGYSGSSWGGNFGGTYGVYAQDTGGYFSELANGSWGLYTNGNINLNGSLCFNGGNCVTGVLGPGATYVTGDVCGGVLHNCSTYAVCSSGGYMVGVSVDETNASGAIVWGTLSAECEF